MSKSEKALQVAIWLGSIVLAMCVGALFYGVWNCDIVGKCK